MGQPFLVVNPKSYLFGQELFDLALGADRIASKSSVKIYFTAPFTELARIASSTDHIVVTAQHMDPIKPGRGMGKVSLESLTSIGVFATFLNHAENPLDLSVLRKTIQRTQEVAMTTIICADSPEEAVAVATLNPSIVLAEPTALIGTGQAPDDSYITTTIEAIRKVNPTVQVMIASGVSSPDDVARVIRLGADGTGATSGIISKQDPILEIAEWVKAIQTERR